MALGLTYENKKDSLGNGISIGIFGNGKNNSYDPGLGSYYGGDLDGVEIVAQRNTSMPDESKNNTWVIVAAALVLVAIVWMGKKFFK